MTKTRLILWFLLLLLGLGSLVKAQVEPEPELLVDGITPQVRFIAITAGKWWAQTGSRFATARPFSSPILSLSTRTPAISRPKAMSAFSETTTSGEAITSNTTCAAEK